MTRRALPKAIVRSIEHLHEVRSVDKSARPRAASPLPGGDEEPTAQHSVSQQTNTRSPSAHPKPAELMDSSASSIKPNSQVSRRRAEAKKIVERYKMYAAVGGLVPFAAVNIAGVTAIILRMIKALCDLYQAPFERDRTRSFVVGLMGGAVPTGLAAATASTLSFVTPAAGFVGLAISSVSAGAFTRSIGLVFVDHFENEASLADNGRQ
jgi:uncharacterized protein (DUF697 family)